MSRLESSQTAGVPLILLFMGESDFLLYSGGPLIGWSPLIQGKGICFINLGVQKLVSSRNSLTDTHRITFDQMCRHMAQSSWHITLAIILTLNPRHRAHSWACHLCLVHSYWTKAVNVHISQFLALTRTSVARGREENEGELKTWR